MTNYTKEKLMASLVVELPSVRVRYDRVGITEDGQRIPSVCETAGRLEICEEEVYVEIWAGRWKSEKFTWEQVLQHLNEPFSTLLFFPEEIEYRV